MSDSFTGLADGSTGAFLDFLWGGLDGYVFVGELRTNGEKSWMEHTPFMWPDDRNTIAAYIEVRSETEQVYVSPPVYRGPEPRKEHFKASNVAWCEYDNGLPNNLPNTPTVKINSSVGKQHHYYRMVEPFVSITELEATNRQITYATGADKGGWDAAQFLRPVGSYNHKYEQPYKVNVDESNDKQYTRTDFESGYTLPGEVDQSSGSSNTSIELPAVLPNAADILLRYAFPDTVARLYRQDVMPPTKRHDGLMALAYSLAEMGLNEAEIYVLIAQKDIKWGKFVDRPDKKERYLGIVAEAKRKIPEPTLDTLPKEEGESPTEEEDEETPLPGRDLLILGWNSLANLNVNYEWIGEELWLEKTSSFILGIPGIGKTQLSMRLCMNLALGREEWLGYALTRQRKVLFLSLELNDVGLKFFQDLMNPSFTDEERDVLQEKFISVPVGYAVDLGTPYGQAVVDYLIEQVQPDVLLVDSMGSAAPGGLLSTEHIARVLGYIERLNSRGIASWIISHPRKVEATGAKARRPVLHDLFGDQSQGRIARAVYGVFQEDPESSIEWSTLKQTFAPPDNSIKLLKRTYGLDFEITGTTTIKEEKKKSSKQEDDPKSKALGTI